MYKGGYVLAVIANGDVVSEDESRQICLPFGSEYKVRLINKNDTRCAADLIVNGEEIARFIIDGGNSADIERYIDNDLTHGKKFKFVSLNDSKVKDKKDIDNGLIEAHFFREKKKQDPIVIREYHHYHDRWHPIYPEPYPRNPYPSSPIWYTTTDNVTKGLSCGSTSDYCSITTNAAGATVRGSDSNQEFSYASGYEWDSIATILKLKIVNGEYKIVTRYCSGCGRKKRDGDKYCSNCGVKI